MPARASRLATALIAAGALLFVAPLAPWSPLEGTAVARKASKRAKRTRRKRDPFARAPQVLDIAGKSKTGALTAGQVAKVMHKVAPRLEPCLVFERRRDPELRGAFIEFVITGAGHVLATRVNKKRFSSLARCIHKKLRATARFPKSKLPRQVAGFNMRLAQ
ncbi:MAG: hypothetical protein KC503_41260 [Myxococcales bacterium]|nr:hypothetical protein [Myxococcales bacterium]